MANWSQNDITDLFEQQNCSSEINVNLKRHNRIIEKNSDSTERNFGLSDIPQSKLKTSDA